MKLSRVAEGRCCRRAPQAGCFTLGIVHVSHPLPQLRFCLSSTEHCARTQPTVLHPASAPRVLPQPVEEQRLLAALWGCSTPRGSAAPYHTWKCFLLPAQEK